MATEARIVNTPAEIGQVWRAVSAGFGEVYEPDNESTLASLSTRAQIEELAIGASVDGAISGGCFGLEMDLALPGGSQLPAVGLLAVGMDPSVIGRGGMTAMMELHLCEARRLGLAGSVLMATESGLYGRFGYGLISTLCAYEIKLDRSALRPDSPVGDGSVRLLLDSEEVRPVVASVHDVADKRAGMTSRPDPIWDLVLADKPSWVGGGKRLTAAYYPAGSETADGYIIYRVKPMGQGHRVTAGRVVLDEYVALSLEAELALWEFVCRTPLARSLEWTHAPTDPVVVHHLVDPRQLIQTRRVDNLWMRILDVPAMLEARHYEADGDFGFVLDDQIFTDQSGHYSVKVTGGRAQVSFDPSSAVDPEVVVLSEAQLASLLVGEYRAAVMVRAGLIGGGATRLDELDRIMSTSQPPYSLTKF